MKPILSVIARVLSSLMIFLLLSVNGKSQTPGTIIRDGNGAIPAAAFSSVLDPNQDGFTSVANSGFTTNDIGAVYSEIPYKVIPPIFPEPIGDLRRGPDGRFSDISFASDGSGFYMYYDAVNSRVLLRLRVSSIMRGSKGYSALLDTDGKFGNIGADADPTYQGQTSGVNGNPGFEYEIVYETNFRIAVYDVNNSCGTTPNPVWTLDLAANPGYAQTSIALGDGGGNTDFFYDWWVPLSAFTGTAGAITPTTKLRAQTTTVMAPKGAICGPKSDIYGDDDRYKTPQAQYEASILAQPIFTLNDVTPGGSGIGPICSDAPVITSPAAASFSPSVTTISGTSTEANGTVITIFRNRAGTETALSTLPAQILVSGGSWTATLTASQLLDADVVYAKAQASGESQCNKSNQKIASSCNAGTAPAAPAVCFAKKGITVTRTNASYSVIFYLLTNAGEVEMGRFTPPATLSNVDVTFDATNVYLKGGCTGGPGTTNGTYKIVNETTAAPVCQSLPVYGCVSAAGGQAVTTTAAPAITTSPIVEGTTSISGTIAVASASNTLIRLFIGGAFKASTVITAGATTWTINSLSFNLGDIVIVTAQGNSGASNGTCMSAATANYTVQCFTPSPIINTNPSSQLTAGAPITGVIAAAAGTTVRVYTSTNVLVSTVAVAADSTFTTSPFNAVAGTQYYAVAQKTSCGISANSATFAAAAANATDRCNNAGLFSAASYYENGAITMGGANVASIGGTLSGTAVANTQVILYIDNNPIDTVLTSTNTWSATINSAYYNIIYPDGVLSISTAENGKLETACATTRTVLCIPPTTATVVSLEGSPGAKYGSISYTITNSQLGVLYILEDNINGSSPSQTIGKDRGISKFGNGGSLTLTSDVFPEPGYYNLRITAVKLGSLNCEPFLPLNVVAPLNTTYSINDENSTWQNTGTSGNVLTNDFDLENDTQNFGSFLAQNFAGIITSGSSVSGLTKQGAIVPIAGTISFDASGNYTFNPDAAFTGTVQLPYNVCDNGNPTKCDTAFLMITVDSLPTTGANSVIANNDENISYGVTVSGNLFANDVDPQGDAFGITTFVYDTNGNSIPDTFSPTGTVTVAGVDVDNNPVVNAGSLTISTIGSYSYTPAPGFTGLVNVIYIVTDANGAQAQATLHIDVLADVNGALNNPPLVADDFGYTTVNLAVTGNVLINDSDPNGDPLLVTAQTTTIPGAGTLVLLTNGNYTFTPVAGYVGPVSFSYQACDVTAITPQPLCSNATLHILVGPGINIAGKVWADANGNTIQDGVGEPATNLGGTLFVNLVNALGNVIETATVANDGKYSFTNITPGKNYSLILSTTNGLISQPAPSPSLPAGYVNTGETRNGTIDLGVAGAIDSRTYGFTNAVNFNFGVNGLPTADDISFSIGYPTVDQLITLNGGGNPLAFSGTDPEDCNSGCTLTNHTVIINTIPANGELYYNGVLVTSGQQINNFDPALLDIKITAATIGSSNISFGYSFADAAGSTNPVPATYNIFWSPALPVKGLALSASITASKVYLNWKTIAEINSSYFEIERSLNNKDFVKIANNIPAAGNSNTAKQYGFTDDAGNFQQAVIVYYRIKIVDLQGKFSYSNIAPIRLNKDGAIAVWPNPFKSFVTVNFNSRQNNQFAITVADMAGKTIARYNQRVAKGLSQLTIDGVGNFPKGMYLLDIKDQHTGKHIVYKLIKE